jgi:hypothetical protein
MIAARTGEIEFRGGLRITAHAFIEQVSDALPRPWFPSVPFRSKAGGKYELGEHASNFVTFAVEAVTVPSGA